MVVMAAQLCENTKKHRNTHFNLIMMRVAYELNFSVKVENAVIWRISCLKTYTLSL